jgi:hypothetical protein
MHRGGTSKTTQESDTQIVHRNVGLFAGWGGTTSMAYRKTASARSRNDGFVWSQAEFDAAKSASQAGSTRGLN